MGRLPRTASHRSTGSPSTGSAAVRPTPVRPAAQYGQPASPSTANRSTANRSTANPSTAQPQYGQPQYGQPQYGQPQYGAPAGYRPAPLQPGIVPLRPLGLGEIYDGAFRSIRHNPRVMFGLPVLVVAIGSVLAILISYALMPIIRPFIGNLFADLGTSGELTGSTVDQMTNLYVSTLGVAVGTLPMSFVANTVLTGLLTVSVSRSVLGQRIALGDLWRSYGKRALLLIPYSILLGLFQLLASAVVLTPGVALIAARSEGAGVLLLVVGILLLVVGTVWFVIRTMLIPPAIVLEGQPLWTSVKRGWVLSRGYFWRLLGIYALAGVIVWFIEQVISVPLAMVMTFAALSTNSLLTVVLNVLTQALALIITLTFLAPVVALLYVDVRMRAEGLDIELARASEAAT